METPNERELDATFTEPQYELHVGKKVTKTKKLSDRNGFPSDWMGAWFGTSSTGLEIERFAYVMTLDATEPLVMRRR